MSDNDPFAREGSEGFTAQMGDEPTEGRLSDDVYRQIQNMVMSGEFAPSSRVRESRLSRLLGVSRTPIREALGRLAAEGLLRELPHQGYVVVDVGPEELRSIYEVRSVLEGFAAEQAARRAKRIDLAILEDLVDAMEQQFGEDREQELSTKNREFHQAVVRASGNSYLEAILKDVEQITHRFRRTAIALTARRVAAHQEHKELLDAMRAHDPAQAKEVASKHVMRALETRLGLGAPDGADGANGGDGAEAGSADGADGQ